MIAINSSDDEGTEQNNKPRKRARPTPLPDDDIEEWRARMLALLASPERTPHTIAAAPASSSFSIPEQQAKLLREQEAENQRRIREDERSRQERMTHLLELTNHPDKDTSLAAMQALLEQEDDDQSAKVVHNHQAQAAIGLSRQECIHFQHITRFVPGLTHEQMTDIIHDKIVALMGRRLENSYVIGITTDPFRRFYTADFSYRRLFGAAAKGMYILLKCSAIDAKDYETRLIRLCRLCGPPKILNIKNGGDGLSDLNPNECYVYMTIRSG